MHYRCETHTFDASLTPAVTSHALFFTESHARLSDLLLITYAKFYYDVVYR